MSKKSARTDAKRTYRSQLSRQLLVQYVLALILCAADLSGRSMLCADLQIPAEKIGTFDTELTEEFLTAFVREAGITLHLRQLSGSNSHHIVEGVFKALARTLRRAVSIDPDAADEIPSTKGVL